MKKKKETVKKKKSLAYFMNRDIYEDELPDLVECLRDHVAFLKSIEHVHDILLKSIEDVHTK